MRTVVLRRVIAPIAYVACLVAGPAVAQVGPSQPVLVLTEGKSESLQKRLDLPGSYAVPAEVFVASDGRVIKVLLSGSSGNPDADSLATGVLREKKFLPALDASGRPTAGTARVTVSMVDRGPGNVVKVVAKAPALSGEIERVRRMKCADFIWEVERLEKQGGVDDASNAVMPYASARLYMMQKHIASEDEGEFWGAWPGAFQQIVDRCQKDGLQLYIADVLTPTLDGAMPVFETVAASSSEQ